MHELSVTESILEISLRHANKVNAKRITNLYLVIGQLASIVDDSVQFYWDIISKGTIAEGAMLHFQEATCNACMFGMQPSVSIREEMGFLAQSVTASMSK